MFLFIVYNDNNLDDKMNTIKCLTLNVCDPPIEPTDGLTVVYTFL